MFRSSNPAMRAVRADEAVADSDRAGYSRIAAKGIFFAVITLVSALSVLFLLNIPSLLNFFVVFLIVSVIGALICGFVAVLIPSATKIFGTLYCVFEGFMLGFISLVVETVLPGVVAPALIATILVFLIMGIIYVTGLVKVTQKFMKVFFAVFFAVMLTYFILWIISLFSGAMAAMFFGNTVLSLIVCVVMVILAAVMLLLDFERIRQTVEGGMHKKYEWVAAFGLIVTLIWLYVEMLRLFMILASRRR